MIFKKSVKNDCSKSLNLSEEKHIFRYFRYKNLNYKNKFLNFGFADPTLQLLNHCQCGTNSLMHRFRKSARILFLGEASQNVLEINHAG